MSKIIHNMILSASGWRKIFVSSGKEDDKDISIGTTNEAISIFAAKVFSDYIKKITSKDNPTIVCARDTRPTGETIAHWIIKTFISENINVKYTGIAAAPEVMSHAKLYDGFIYISASHNPIGHNGIKFGLNDGGVVCGSENAKIVKEFEALCNLDNAEDKAKELISKCSEESFKKILELSSSVKKESLKTYKDFTENVTAPFENESLKETFFDLLKQSISKNNIGIVCDMNGSARSLSIDTDVFKQNGINFYPFNNIPGEIVHAIIPEPENLVYVADKLEKLQESNVKDAILGYMPDCDGDRGNIVYYDEKLKKAQVLKAQEVFSLSVLAELTFMTWKASFSKDNCGKQTAVAVNGPTSMRIDEIAKALNSKVFRAEVGEANVVNLAREKRNEGFEVRILGEGSNGGTITYPASVRDPLNTIFAFIKLLVIKDIQKDGKTIKGLFHIWCDCIGAPYNEDFALSDVIKTLPEYTTTGVSEKRALLHTKNSNHAELKARFQKAFEKSWQDDEYSLRKKYNLTSYTPITTNGTNEILDITDYSVSGKGGLKIVFYMNNSTEPDSFIWMRPSGTESVFRIMCDVKGKQKDKEKELLEWETNLIKIADEV